MKTYTSKVALAIEKLFTVLCDDLQPRCFFLTPELQSFLEYRKLAGLLGVPPIWTGVISGMVPSRSGKQRDVGFDWGYAQRTE